MIVLTSLSVCVCVYVCSHMFSTGEFLLNVLEKPVNLMRSICSEKFAFTRWKKVSLGVQLMVVMFKFVVF